MTLSVDIANRAIQLIGDNQPAITGSGNYPTPTFDTSTAGLACTALYVGVVNTVGRQFGWDFARSTAALQSGNLGPIISLGVVWKYEYLYPTNGVQVRQLVPTTITDPNNPLPIRWSVGNDLIAGVPTKVILTNLAAGFAVYSGQVTETLWDAGFTEVVVRLLASELAMAIAGRPETVRSLLETMQGFETPAETRDS
jgi:hypothetical protein